MPDKRRVLAANYAFYAAFRFADLEAMDALWSRNRAVAMLRPDGRGVHGRKAVMAFWRQLMKDGEPPDVRPREMSVIMTEKTAMVICTEDHGTRRMLATNVFVKERLSWRMTHHQASSLTVSTTS